MKRTWVYDKNGHATEITPTEVRAITQVMPDVGEFRSPDGKRISSRSEWREHLKRTDSIEMGHSDIAAQREKWTKKKEKFQERLNNKRFDADKFVKPAEMPTEIRERERSAHSREVANRLDGRPTPSRIELIKLALDVARRR